MPHTLQDRKMEKFEDRLRAVENAVVEISSSTKSIDSTLQKLEKIYTETLPRLGNIETRMTAIEESGNRYQEKVWKLVVVLLAALLGVSVVTGQLPIIKNAGEAMVEAVSRD